MRHRILYSVSCVGAVAGGRYIHARDDSVYVVLTFLGEKNTMTDIESIRLYSPLFASIARNNRITITVDKRPAKLVCILR